MFLDLIEYENVFLTYIYLKMTTSTSLHSGNKFETEFSIIKILPISHLERPFPTPTRPNPPRSQIHVFPLIYEPYKMKKLEKIDIFFFKIYFLNGFNINLTIKNGKIDGTSF